MRNLRTLTDAELDQVSAGHKFIITDSFNTTSTVTVTGSSFSNNRDVTIAALASGGLTLNFGGRNGRVPPGHLKKMA